MHFAAHVSAGMVMLALAACASAPVALLALPPAPAAGTRAAGPGPSVLLREVSVPGYLDSFPVIVGRDGGALVVSKNTEWAERPSAGVARVLRDALSQRLDPARVLVSGERRIPDVDLFVEFLALNPQGTALHLDARWHFSCTASRASRAGRTQFDVPLSSPAPSAVAAATTAALAGFANALIDELPTDCRGFAPDMAGASRRPLAER